MIRKAFLNSRLCTILADLTDFGDKKLHEIFCHQFFNENDNFMIIVAYRVVDVN